LVETICVDHSATAVTALHERSRGGKIKGNRNGRWDWQCKKRRGKGRKCQANLGQVS